MKTLSFMGFNYATEDVLVDMLAENDSQPPERSAMDNPKRRALLKDMERNGQLSPISVVKDNERCVYTILQGHGRSQAAALLGWKTIRAHVFEQGSPTQMALLRTVIHKSEKSTTKNLSSNDQMAQQLLEWRAGHRGEEFELSHHATHNLNFLINQFGEAGAADLVFNKGITHDYLAGARKITRLVLGLSVAGPMPSEGDGHVKVAVLWLMKHKMIHIARAWLEAGKSARTLYHQYILLDRPLPRPRDRRRIKIVPDAQVLAGEK